MEQEDETDDEEMKVADHYTTTELKATLKIIKKDGLDAINNYKNKSS